jgi:ABC-type sugar transport system ATPase subunit
MAHMPARVTRAFYAEASGDLGLSGLGDTVNIAEKKRHFDEVLTTNETLAPVRLYDQLCLRERASAHRVSTFSRSVVISGRRDGGMTKSALSARAVSKYFGATCALANVDFELFAGEVHALIGENGAGKSTLVRILSGVIKPDQGEVFPDGQRAAFDSPRDAMAAGIVTIPQELRLVPSLSIAENLTLGDPPVKRVLGMRVIDRRRMRTAAGDQLAQLGLALDPRIRVDRLSYAERQLVAIAKALRRHCKVLILDEPTAALESREVERLFTLIERMKREGTAILHVTHRLDEVDRLADRCTVLRDGQVATVARRGNFKIADLIVAMTGGFEMPPGDTVSQPGGIVLEDVSRHPDAIRLRANEVLGLAGLLSSGAGRMLRRLFGFAGERIELRRNGVLQQITSPADAIGIGIGFVPDERRLGLIMNQSIHDNILLPSLDVITRGGRIDRGEGKRLVEQMMELLDIRPRRPELPVAKLSGGNQQKVIMAKWLARAVGVLLLDEPTQGIDVAAKAQIHTLIRNFAKRGGGVLVRSSDLTELTLICDEILAVHQAHIADRLQRSDGYDEQRLHAAIGG